MISRRCELNYFMRYGLWFVAGVAVGATGVNLLTRKDNPLRGAMVGALAHGIAAKEKVLISLEIRL